MAFVLAYSKRTEVIASAAGGTVVMTQTDQYDIDEVTLNVKNNHATVAIDGAVLEFKSHPSAGWVAVETSGWGTADNIVTTATNLAALAAATETVIRFKPGGIYGWRLTLSADTSAGGPVDVWGVGTGEIKGNPIPS